MPGGFEAYARLDHQRQGVLPEEVTRVLVDVLTAHTTTREAFWLALWEGYGTVYGPGPSFKWFTFTFDGPANDEPPPPRFALRFPPFRVRGTPRIRLPDREYVLYRGAPERVPGWHDGPNLWWPDDHAWCVASEIDLPWTYVGGSSGLISEILERPGLNSRPLSLDETTGPEPN